MTSILQIALFSMFFSTHDASAAAPAATPPAATDDADACAGKEGDDLAKCQKDQEKAAKKADRRAKQDARSAPFLPSQLDPKFKTFDTDNPFAKDEYRVRYNACGIPQVDSYTLKAAQLKGTVVMTRYFIDQVKAGNKAILVQAPALVQMLAQVPQKGQALVTEGQGLLASLPSVLATQPLKLPKAMNAVKDAVTNVTNAVGEAPAVIKDAGEILKKDK